MLFPHPRGRSLGWAWWEDEWRKIGTGVLMQGIRFSFSENKQLDFSTKTNCTFPLYGTLIETFTFSSYNFPGECNIPQALCCVWLFVTPCDLPGSSVHYLDFPGKNTGVGYHCLLQGTSWPKDWTHVSCVSCIGRRILYLWVTWEALPQRWT